MKNKTPWYKWPENKQTGIVPWYTILRRAIFTPLVFTGGCIMYIGFMFGYSRRDATKFWKENF